MDDDEVHESDEPGLSDEQLRELGFANREEYEEYRDQDPDDVDPYRVVARENCRAL